MLLELRIHTKSSQQLERGNAFNGQSTHDQFKAASACIADRRQDAMHARQRQLRAAEQITMPALGPLGPPPPLCPHAPSRKLYRARLTVDRPAFRGTGLGPLGRLMRRSSKRRKGSAAAKAQRGPAGARRGARPVSGFGRGAPVAVSARPPFSQRAFFGRKRVRARPRQPTVSSPLDEHLLTQRELCTI